MPRIASTISGIVMTGGDSRPVARAVAARLAEEHDDNQARHVERGQECGESANGENRQVAFVGERENRVLAEESAERRTADQRQRADEKVTKVIGSRSARPPIFQMSCS